MKIFLVEEKYVGENGIYNLNVTFNLEKYILSKDIQHAIKLFKINYQNYEITDIELLDKEPIIEKELNEE